MGTTRRALVVLWLLSAPAVAMAVESTCGACHATVLEAGHSHPLAGTREGAPACADCHVQAEVHAANPLGASTMMTFADEAARARSDACAGCHASAHPRRGTSPHQQAGVACNDCHVTHSPATPDSARLLPAGYQDLDAASATCVACHEAVFTQFAFNERHRLAEGSVTCVSCHDPHDAEPRSLLGHAGESRCVSCHRSAAGPFVFEHSASRVDGCGSCHEPHGSPNRHLLTHQQVGELCYSCHVLVPQFHIGFAPGAPARFGQDSVCTNCHTAIHGSNFDRNFLR
ncbi:MAG: cytochrome c3 family protein [Pseudomonadales bacterium]